MHTKHDFHQEFGLKERWRSTQSRPLPHECWHLPSSNLILVLTLTLLAAEGCSSIRGTRHSVRKPPAEEKEQPEGASAKLAKATARLLPNRSPEAAKTYSELAQEYHRQNRPEVAARLYREAIRANPKDPRLHYLCAHSLGMAGDRDGSIAEAKAAVKLDPDYAEAQALLGILLRHAGRNAEALEALDAAWRLSPPSVPAGLELAAWEMNHDRPEEATRILEVCQIYQPGDSRVLLLQAEALERSGKLVEAEKAWRALADRGVGGADALEHLSDINEELGNRSLAKSFREEAKRINPFELASQPRRRTVRARPYSDKAREFPPLISPKRSEE